MKVFAALCSPLSLAAGSHLAQENRPSQPALYPDSACGFSLQALAFDAVKENDQVVPVLLMGPETDGFSSNVNVVVQPAATREHLVTRTFTKQDDPALEKRFHACVESFAFTR